MSTAAPRLAAALLVAERRQPPLQLGDGAVDRGEVLGRARRQRPVELGERARRRQLLGALDQRPLQLAAQVALEAADLLAVERRPSSVLRRRAAGLQAERAADPLHVDADHARALALAPEGGDRQPGEVAHLAVVALGDRLADRLAQLVEVEPVAALVALGPRAMPRSSASASAARKK